METKSPPSGLWFHVVLLLFLAQKSKKFYIVKISIKNYQLNVDCW